MALLGKLGFASNASRRLPHAIQLFEHCESTRTSNFVGILKNTKILHTNRSEFDLKTTSIIFKRNLTLSIPARLPDKPKKGAIKKTQSNVSQEKKGDRPDWSRLDHDCNKIQKVLLAQATTAPIRKVKGPHEVRSCSNVQNRGQYQIQRGTCKQGTRYKDLRDVDYVTTEKANLKDNDIFKTKSQPDSVTFEPQNKACLKSDTDMDFIQDTIRLTSAYITTSSTCLGSDKNDNSEFIPPFFHILPKIKEREKNKPNENTKSIEDMQALLKDHHVNEYIDYPGSSNNASQSGGYDSKDSVPGKQISRKKKAVKQRSSIKHSNEGKLVGEANPYDSIPIIGTTLMPPLQSDKQPPPPKVDCQTQLPEGGKKGDCVSKDTPKDSAQKASVDDKKQPIPNFLAVCPSCPNCGDGGKGIKDPKKRKDTKGDNCIDCGKDKGASLVAESSGPKDGKEDVAKPIDYSKYVGQKGTSQSAKGRKEAKNGASQLSKSKEEAKRGVIDSSKLKPEGKDTKLSDASKKADQDSLPDCCNSKDESKSKEGKNAIQQLECCSNGKYNSKGKDDSKSKETGEKIDCSSDSKVKDLLQKKPDGDAKDMAVKGGVAAKGDKSAKASQPGIKGCGEVTLDSGERTIDCRVIKADKKDNKGANEDVRPIDCSKYEKQSGDQKSASKDDKDKTYSKDLKPIDHSKYAKKFGDQKPASKDDKDKGSSKDLKPIDCSKYKKAGDQKQVSKDDKDKASGKDPKPIDYSKYQKSGDQSKPKEDSGKPGSEASGGSVNQFCSGKKEESANKLKGSSSSGVISKGKDCKPVMCTKNLEKPVKPPPPPPPKVDPAKRIKVQEVPKIFNCCLKITGPEKVKIENCPMPEACGDMVVVRMKSLGICASDVYMYTRGSQKFGENDISLGHEGAGIVMEVGPACKNLKKGDAVVIEPGVPCGHCKFCRAGRYNICTSMAFSGLFSSYIAHPARFCHKIQKSTKLNNAALAHPLSLALHSCQKGRVSVGSKVLILGACPRGLSTVIAARTMGADKVAIVDTLEKNLKVASELCADIAIKAEHNMNGCQLADKAVAEMKCRPNVVIDCCGCSNTVQMAVNAVERGGHCVLSGCQSECAEFPILPALVKEVCFQSSFRFANTFPRAINMIETGRADVEKMVTHQVEFCEAQDAFHCAEKEEKSGAIKVMVKWPEPVEED